MRPQRFGRHHRQLQVAGLHQFVLANLGDRIPVHIYNNRGHPESSRLFALRQEGGGGETKSISALAKRQRVSFYRLRYASMIHAYGLRPCGPLHRRETITPSCALSFPSSSSRPSCSAAVISIWNTCSQTAPAATPWRL